MVACHRGQGAGGGLIADSPTSAPNEAAGLAAPAKRLGVRILAAVDPGHGVGTIKTNAPYSYGDNLHTLGA